MSCLECRFHGPPVSDYTGPRPCAECIPHNGFPKWEPAEKKEENRVTTKTCAMVVKAGKGWGITYRDGYATSYGWVTFADAVLYDFVEGKPPAYYTGNYQGCNDRELAGAVVKKIERTTETKFVE